MEMNHPSKKKKRSRKQMARKKIISTMMSFEIFLVFISNHQFWSELTYLVFKHGRVIKAVPAMEVEKILSMELY